MSSDLSILHIQARSGLVHSTALYASHSRRRAWDGQRVNGGMPMTMIAHPDLGPIQDRSKGLLSIITPAFNEELNLPLLYQRLQASLEKEDLRWEWIIVDDHSTDQTFAAGLDLARHDLRVKLYRFSRNFGSHAAIFCGLDHASGDCAVVMAADLQDSPEVIPALVDRWRSGSNVVWAVRSSREGEKVATRGFARLYYLLMRKVAGLHNIPSSGADFFLIDRRAIEAVRGLNERNASLFALIAWAGFEQAEVRYIKKARAHGQSKWTVSKKLKLAVDSLTSFTFLPVRWLFGMGALVAAFGLFYALLVVANAILGQPEQGWSSLMVAVLILGGSQMIMLGVLGEYLWRALDEARRRPRYILETYSGERLGSSEVDGLLATSQPGALQVDSAYQQAECTVPLGR